MRTPFFLLALALVAFSSDLHPVAAATSPGVTLSGRLFDDRNGNGFDDNEPCVNGVVSLVSATTGKSATWQVDCSQSPMFIFRGLTVGNYFLGVKSTSPPNFTLPGVTVMVSAGGSASLQHDLALRNLTQPISGLVALDKNGNRQLDTGEPPLAGIRVDLLNAASKALLATASTGSAGDFAFDVTTPGDFVVMTHDPPGTVGTGALGGSSGHASPLSANQIRVTVNAGEAATGLAFLYRSTAGTAISGKAWLDSNGDGSLNGADTALGNLDVRLLDTAGNLVAATRTLDDGSYFFDAPPVGHSYLVTTLPSFGVQPRLALAGPGASSIGRNAILIPDFETGGSYSQNNFLLGRGSGPALPPGPASIQGFVVTQQPGRRGFFPLAGAQLLLRDATGALRASGQTDVHGTFLFDKLPTGSYTLVKTDPPGYLPVDAVPGQNGAKVDVNTMTVRMSPGFNTYAGFEFIDRPGPAVSAQNSIQGTVSGDTGGQVNPLPGTVVVLQDRVDRLIGVTTTDSGGQYRFGNLTTDVYRVVAADAPGATGGDALPGPNAAKIDTRTIQVTMVPTVGLYGGNNFVETLSTARPGRIQRVLAVGDAVPSAGRLGIFDAYPQDQDRDVSAIRRHTDDGALYVADYAGTALLHVGDSAATAGAPSPSSATSGPSALQDGSGQVQVLVDATTLDPLDQVGIARILRVETSRDGTSAVLALRADNTRGVYRWANGRLTRLGLLPTPYGPAELDIADNNQIAFVAADANGALALFQTNAAGAAAPVVELLRQGQGVLLNATIESFTDLSTSPNGDLAILTILKTANGGNSQVVIRKSSAGLSLAATAGQRVAPDASGTAVAPLLTMRRPRIGPDGTIVFLGSGDGFTNFYVNGPNRSLQPLLRGAGWNGTAGTFDYEIAADGSVALMAAQGQSTDDALYFVSPTGAATLIAPAGGSIQPTGRPVFTNSLAQGQLFFLAKNLDRPLDPNGHIPVVLCQSPIANSRPVLDPNGAAVVSAVAAPGDPVPGHPALQLLTITQRPRVAAKSVAFGALFGGRGKLAVPTAGLFRVPLGGTLADARMLADEGSDLPGSNRVAMLRAVEYARDGSLTFGGLMPGAGPLIGTVSPTSVPTTAGPSIAATRFHIQANPAPTVTPLVAIGQPLDRPDHRLLAVIGRLVALNGSAQLLVARFSRSDGSVGEGLFQIAAAGVQAIAVTDDPAPGVAGATFAGFSNSASFTLNPPAVSNDGNVVFKARLNQGGGPTFGLFQWNGTTVSLVGLSNPNPDTLALTTDDQGPYTFDRWEAGLSGSAFLMEQHQTRSAVQVTRLFGRSPAGLTPLVVPGSTPVQGGTSGKLGGLFDYVLDGAGSLFVSAAAGSTSGLMALQPAGLAPMVMQGQAIPVIAGADTTGRTFDGTFSLVPDSSRGSLVFIAGVSKKGDVSRRGLFKRNATGGIDTVMVEGLGVVGARNVTVDTLAASSIRQTVNGTTASAILSNGRWQILRTRAAVDSHGKATFTTVVVAQEGQSLAGGLHVVLLDPSAVLDLPAGSGPVFTLNEAGNVAFMASDGQHWGVYLFSDAGP